MQRSKFFMNALFLITIPGIAFSPSTPLSQGLEQSSDHLSSQDELELLERDYTLEDLSKIDQFLDDMTTEGMLNTDPESLQQLGKEVEKISNYYDLKDSQREKALAIHPIDVRNDRQGYIHYLKTLLLSTAEKVKNSLLDLKGTQHVIWKEGREFIRTHKNEVIAVSTAGINIAIAIVTYIFLNKESRHHRTDSINDLQMDYPSYEQLNDRMIEDLPPVTRSLVNQDYR